MSRDAKDTVYCSIQMPIAQGELEMSIEFLEGILAGEGQLDHQLH